MQIIQDLITQRVDGLAISVSDVGAAIGVIKAAREAGIPVITFDADAPGSAREAYIGTNNKDLGRALGEMLVKAQPHAGTYGMVFGRPRRGQSQRAPRGNPRGGGEGRLEGGVGLAHLLQRRSGPRRPATQRPDDGFKSGKLVVVAADTLPSELQLLKEGYVAALVGQRPFEMGEKSMDTLLALQDGKSVQEIIYTGVDRVTKDNVGEFLK